ncbi:hypothetical protein Tco_1048950 [Tanacetum coccineum]
MNLRSFPGCDGNQYSYGLESSYWDRCVIASRNSFIIFWTRFMNRVVELEGGGGGRGVKEKHDGLGNTDVLIGSCLEYKVPSLSGGATSVSTQEGGLEDGNTCNGEATGQVHEVTNDGIPNKASFESVLKEAPTSYANMLSPTFFIKANLWKLDANVPKDADFHICLPLTSVYKVNGRMKNSLYGYFISKKLAFPVMEWFVRNNWQKYGLEKVTLLKGKTNASTSGNGTFSLSDSFKALNVDNTVTEEVKSGDRTSMSSVLEEGKSVYDSEDEVEPVDNEMGTYGNAYYDYDPYDDDMYEG